MTKSQLRNQYFLTTIILTTLLTGCGGGSGSGGNTTNVAVTSSARANTTSAANSSSMTSTALSTTSSSMSLPNSSSSQSSLITSSSKSSFSSLAANFSILWGEAGERFDPAGYLTDFSYAGYRAGEVALPVKTPTINIATQHGAIANDGLDDSAAFVAAIQAAKSGDVIFVPEGTFILKQIINIPNGVVFQGAGSAKTIIDIPISLTDVAAGDYSFGGGFITAKGSTNDGAKLSDITTDANRGDRRITLASTAGISVGQWIQIEQTDTNGDLLIDALYLNNTEGTGDYTDLLNDRMMEFFSRVSAIEGNTITLERALPLAVKAKYKAQVHSVNFRHQEVGIEGFTMRFPQTTYPGHFNELGYNAIDVAAAHSWVRDVTVMNVDYGFNFKDSHFITATDLRIINENNRSGHHGINIGRGSDILIQNFDVQAVLLHDLTIEFYTFGNVYTKGKGINLSMDHHKGAPYANLFCELELGLGSRAWTSGGSSNRGYHTAAYATFWNIKASNSVSTNIPAWPSLTYGPNMVFVGFETNAVFNSTLNWWHEEIPAANLSPQNIWLAQRSRRGF